MKTQIAIIESALDSNVTKYLVMLRETHEITYCHSIATAYYTINLLEKVNLTEEQKKKHGKRCSFARCRENVCAIRDS